MSRARNQSKNIIGQKDNDVIIILQLTFVVFQAFILFYIYIYIMYLKTRRAVKLIKQLGFIRLWEM